MVADERPQHLRVLMDLEALDAIGRVTIQQR